MVTCQIRSATRFAGHQKRFSDRGRNEGERTGPAAVMLPASNPEPRMKPIPLELVFLAAKRTAFGTYGGALKDVTATDLGVHAAKAALAQARVKPEDVDNDVFCNVLQTRAPPVYLHRHLE